ncbi:MAG: primosomal protein N' [Chthoniobacterales bacterium]
MYAHVLIDHTEGTRLDYKISEELAKQVFVGSRIRVPLRRMESLGTVLEIKKTTSFAKIKEILGMVASNEAPLFSPVMMKLAHWMADYYCASLDAVLRSLMPATIREDTLAEKKVRVASLLKKPTADFLQKISQRAPKQKALLDILMASEKKIPIPNLLKEAVATASSLTALINDGWILVEEEVVLRDPFAEEELLQSPIPKLNSDQERVITQINQELLALEKKSRAPLPFLLHGVTGSGKTEVYLRAIAQTLELGKSALVLVPEIALTPQTVERFRSRFESAKGKGFIAVLHSHLSEGERRDEWFRLHRGEARIAIGARSAIFAPMNNLGLIVVDEEHETSYKQEETPRYHARDVAVMRAQYEGCLIILGSATPSIESYQNTQIGKYRLLELPQRADHQRMPIVRILDLRLQGRRKGADGVLSFPLRQAMTARLERSEQIILFLNRRGFSSSLMCPQCGHVCTCPDCSLSLTFHRVTNQLICHLCGHTAKPPTACPSCHDVGILYSGIGTQRVEAAVRQAFPEARVFRMDTDTMRGKGIYSATLSKFRRQQIDILIGTQMIAKGLDFPNVTLVGIINADMSLHAPDFRAGERTFQLLTQVAGRAGRGDREGEVMIQTFTPMSPSIQFARHHDYLGFFDQECAFRKEFGYPPFQRMILLQLRGREQEKVFFCAKQLREQLKKLIPSSVQLAEAVPAPLERAYGQFRFHIALRGTPMKEMNRVVRQVTAKFPMPHGIKMTIDVDPQSLM